MSMKEMLKTRSFDVPIEKRKKVGKLIKELRESKKLTLTDMFEKTNVGLSDLHKIEYGTKIKINPLQLKAIGNALHTDYKIFYRIVGFLEETDFIDKKNEVEKNEIGDFRKKLIDAFLDNNKGKISDDNLIEILKIMSDLSEKGLSIWIMNGQFLLTNKEV